MTDEELQSAADFIRHGGRGQDAPDPKDFSTLTVTEGMRDGQPQYTVTSSRGDTTDGERNRAAAVFGTRVDTPSEGPIPDNGTANFHAEQRGSRATEDQTDRRQASSNNTVTTRANPDVPHMGAACSHCATHQQTATSSQGAPNPITNVTGNVEDGGRTNNPRNPNAWKNWSEENR